MNTALRAEILAEIRSAILYGFEDQEEILESTLDMFYGDDIDEEWLQEEIGKAYEKQLLEEQHWPSITDFDKLVTAFDALGKDNLIALHKAGVTRQDAMSDAWEVYEMAKEQGMNPSGYCYYHAQDVGRAIESELLLIGFADYEEDERRKGEVGKLLVKRLREQNFQVVWSEDTEVRVEIRNFFWQKRHDERDLGYERALKMLNRF